MRLPAPGETLFLEQSRYKRAGVERVMGFCEPSEHLEFTRECPDFEHMLVNTDTKLFKYHFSVTKKEQRKRFESRKNDPLKLWKTSAADLAPLRKWNEYKNTKEAIFFYTETASCPLTIIKSDDKRASG